MPIPTSYTEATLAAYMLATTGGLGARLELNAASFEEGVVSALLSYGVDDIADAKDIAKLRALARVEAWRTAWSAATGSYDFSADGSSFKRSELAKQAQLKLEQAEREAMAHGGLVGYAVTKAALIQADPYRSEAESE